MKNLTLIFTLLTMAVFSQDSDSIKLDKIQNFLVDNFNKRVGDGVCFTLVDKAVSKAYKNWDDDSRLSGVNKYGIVIDSSSLRIGDIILLKSEYKKPSHIGIVVGFDENNNVLVANQNVAVDNLKESVVVFTKFDSFIYNRIATYYRPYLSK